MKKGGIKRIWHFREFFFSFSLLFFFFSFRYIWTKLLQEKIPYGTPPSEIVIRFTGTNKARSRVEGVQCATGQGQSNSCSGPRLQSRYAHRPETVTPHRLETVTPHRPETVTPHRPETVTPHRPETVTTHRPETVTPHRPETVTPHRPETVTTHRPETVTTHRPETVTPHRPETVTTHRLESRNLYLFLLVVGGGQPNLTQFMPIPHLNLKIGIGINWVKLARTGFFWLSLTRLTDVYAFNVGC